MSVEDLCQLRYYIIILGDGWELEALFVQILGIYSQFFLWMVFVNKLVSKLEGGRKMLWLQRFLEEIEFQSTTTSFDFSI